MARKKEAEDYGRALEREFAQWEHYYEHGGTDPFCPDGVNMALIRNHIAYYKRKIVETMPPESYPEIFHRPDPPEVDGNYFARAGEIRAAAVEALAQYRQDANLRFLRERHDFIPPRDRENLRLDALVWRFLFLEKAVQEDDLQVMRRRRDVAEDLAAFADCAAKVKELSPQQMIQAVQITLF
jgi:hypothetical protein